MSLRIELLAKYCGPLFALALVAAPFSRAAEPLLPDLIPWAHNTKCYMYCGSVSGVWVDNKVVYRFVATTANIGAGPLELREVTHADATQDIYQRVYDTEGSATERLVGSFPDAFSFAPRHLYLLDFAQYNLRTVLAGNGVGPIVSSHYKRSSGVVDSVDYNTSLPGAPAVRSYDNVAGPILGISVGWADVYGTGFPGQWVEVTGLATGQYWLEMVVDPFNRIVESDETNNTVRILIDLNFIPNPQNQTGDYNRNNIVDAADYVVWRDTLGAIYAPPQKAGIGADGDANHRVDAPDYGEWRAHFGVVAAAGTAAALAPEPGTLALLFGVVFAAQTCCRAGR